MISHTIPDSCDLTRTHKEPLYILSEVKSTSRMAQKGRFLSILEPVSPFPSLTHLFSFFAGVCHRCNNRSFHRENTAKSASMEGCCRALISSIRSILCGFRRNTLRQQASGPQLSYFPSSCTSPKDPIRAEGMAGEVAQAQPRGPGALAAPVVRPPQIVWMYWSEVLFIEEKAVRLEPIELRRAA